MKFKLKLTGSIITLVLGVFLSFAPAYAAAPAQQTTCPDSNTPQGQVIQGLGQTGSDCSDGAVTNFAATAVKILSYVVGIMAIIMIVWAGYRYITSGGDSNKVTSAKNTLIYALVGIAVAALAQLLVNTVLTTTNKAVTDSSNTNQSSSSSGNSNSGSGNNP